MKEGRLEVYFLLQWIHKLQIVSSSTLVYSPSSFSELIPLQAAIFIIIIMLLIQVNADGKNKTEQQQFYGQLEFLLHENFITKRWARWRFVQHHAGFYYLFIHIQSTNYSLGPSGLGPLTVDKNQSMLSSAIFHTFQKPFYLEC